MSERAFRLDFFVAIAAVVVSLLSTLTLIYQTHVIGQQYAATIWPYLQVDSSLSNSQERISLDNDGMGPALIRSAQLTVDGKPMQSWNDYLAALSHDLISGAQAKQGRINASLDSVGPSTTIRPGDSKLLFEIDADFSKLPRAVGRHPVELSFCYCSLNGSCWTLRTLAGANVPSSPTPVGACTATSEIASYRNSIDAPTSPSARPRRRSL